MRPPNPARLPYLAATVAIALAVSTVRASSPAHPRSCVDPCASPRSGGSSRVAVVPGDPGAERKRALAAELRGVLDAEWIAEITSGGEDRLRSCIVDLLLDGGRLVEAVDALERLEARARLCVVAGYRLQRGSQPALAARAFALGLAREPDDFSAFEGLADVDPAAALAALARPEPGWYARYSRGHAAQFTAGLLVRCGRTADAVERLAGAAGQGELGPDEWPYFLEIGGDRARDLLLRMAPASGDARLEALCARAIEATGGEDASTDYLADRVARADSIWEIVDVLAERDPARARTALLERTHLRPDDAAGWDALGDLELESGRAAEARAAWLRAIGIEPEVCGRESELWLADADAFLAALRRGAERAQDDEAWGRLGAWSWRSGRRADAIDAWRHARVLDPGDSEWELRLQQAERR